LTPESPVVVRPILEDEQAWRVISAHPRCPTYNKETGMENPLSKNELALIDAVW